MAVVDSPATVLLVEDEFAARLLARLTLEQEGHVVLEAADGACGLHAGPLHLLLIDLLLPDLHGDQVARAVRSRHPNIRALFTSGDPDLQATAVPGSAFLPKPFTPTTLTAKVRQVMAAGR